MSRVTPHGLTGIGHQRIVTNSTATALNATCAAGQAFLISVDHTSSIKHIHVRFDGVAPTINTGISFASDQDPYFLDAVDGYNIRIIGNTVGVVINVAAFVR